MAKITVFFYRNPSHNTDSLDGRSKNVSKNLKQHISNPYCVDQMLCSLCGNQLARFSSKKAKIQRRTWKIQWKFHEKEDSLGYMPQKNLTVYHSSPPIIWIISRSPMKAVICTLINKKERSKYGQHFWALGFQNSAIPQINFFYIIFI